jgi:hypothetical protein
MPTLRRVLFYALLVVFLAACPLAILYVLGYDLRPVRKHPLVHGGGLYVTSFPPGAALYVDGRLYSRPTPTSVLNLPPGAHQVGVQMQGYLPWADRVRIQAGRATLVDDVLLIPRRWQQQPLDEAAFKQLLPFSSGAQLLLRRGSRLADLYLVDTRQEKVLPLALPGSVYAQAEVLAFVPLLEGSALLLEVRLDSLRARLLAELKGGAADLQDVTRLAPEGISGLEWTAGRPGELYFCRDSSVTRIDLASGTVRAAFLGGVRGFGALGQRLYVLGSRGGVFTWDPGEAGLKDLPGFEGIGSLFLPGEFVRLIPLKQGPIVFYGRKSGLVAGLRSGSLPLGAVRGFRVQADPAGLLLWQRRRLGLLRLSPADSARPHQPGKPSLQWFPVRQAGVEQAFLVLAGTHILYRNADRVYLLAGSDGGGRRAVSVTRVRPGTSVFYSEPAGKLFFIDRTTGRISGLEIVRKTQLVEQLLLELRQRF